MSTNRLKKTKKAEKHVIDFRSQQIMCKKLAESMREAAVEMQMQVSGQAAIEGNGEKLIVLYSCYKNGDIIVWFVDKGYYSLMALVNKNFKHMATFPVTEAEKFQDMLTQLSSELGQ
jgi:hypothetical protein